MSRRALSPAARGVLLAVSAALRGRVAAIDDAGDGTTHARVVEPDGTVLLDVRVRAVSGRRDARQPALPLAPGPQHETPAPVAVLADARQPTAPAQDDDAPDDLYRVTIGQHVTLDDEPVEVMGVDVHGFVWRTVATDARGRSVDEGDCEWSEVDETAPGVFRMRAVETETPAQKRETTKAAKPRRATKAPKPAPAAGPVLDDEEALWEIVLEDEPAAPGGLDMLDDETAILWTSTTEKGADRIRTVVPGRLVSEIRTRTLDAGATILREEPSDAPCHLVRVGDEIETTQGLMGLLGTCDDDEIETTQGLMGLLGTCDDVVNAMNGLVLEGARTVDGGKPFVAWADEVKVVDGRLVVGISKWWTAVRGPSGTWRPERLLKERREALAPAKRPKTKPARLVAVPEADALSRHGEVSIVGQQEPGGPWELAASAVRTPPETWTTARTAYHRLRQYARGGRCTRDSADEGGAP